jgi:hypothetical protein
VSKGHSTKFLTILLDKVARKSELARSVTDQRGHSPRWERRVRRQWQSQEGQAVRFGQGWWRCQCSCWMAHCRCSMHGRTRRSSSRPRPAAFRNLSLQSAQSSSPMPALTLCWCCRSVEVGFGHRLDTVDWLAGKSRLLWIRLWCQGSALRMDRMSRQVPRRKASVLWRTPDVCQKPDLVACLRLPNHCYCAFRDVEFYLFC